MPWEFHVALKFIKYTHETDITSFWILIVNE
jgi:hypothetical protein